MKPTTFDEASTEAHRPNAGPATRPKRAASLILIDQEGAAPRILMGRRHAGASFMPGRWVFPGGRCDPVDGRTACATPLSPATLERLARTSPVTTRGAQALAIAALRETFEETGLRFAGADLAALRFVARAVTPPALARRFDAHFFEADADALTSREPRASAELDAVAWLTIAQARTSEVAGVTRLLLDEIELRLADPERPPLSIRMTRGRRDVRAVPAKG